MREDSMKNKPDASEMSEIELEAIRNLDAMSDEDIDTSDIPEQTDWTDSVRGKFYDPEPHRSRVERQAELIDEPRG